MPSTEESDQPNDDEVAFRRDEVVKRMLATPPQPRPAKPAKSSPKASRPS